jgi:hypothetical protein
MIRLSAADPQRHEHCRRTVTMLLFDDGQRALLADKLPDAANLAAGALFFGQFLSDRPFSLGMAIAGIASWAALVSWGLVLARRGDS